MQNESLYQKTGIMHRIMIPVFIDRFNLKRSAFLY